MLFKQFVARQHWLKPQVWSPKISHSHAHVSGFKNVPKPHDT
jgi:hypothetical protein